MNPYVKRLNWIYIGLIGLLSLCSCTGNSPNSTQVLHTRENMECYKELLFQIKNNGIFRSAETLRNQQNTRGFDPVWIRREERIISIEEMKELIDSNWVSKCYNKLNSKNDIRGVRMINDSCTIIEIDYFNSRSMNTMYSRHKVLEFHRLISRKCDQMKYSFYFGSEKITFSEIINEEFIYQVTQMDDPR